MAEDTKDKALQVLYGFSLLNALYADDKEAIKLLAIDDVQAAINGLAHAGSFLLTTMTGDSSLNPDKIEELVEEVWHIWSTSED